MPSFLRNLAALLIITTNSLPIVSCGSKEGSDNEPISPSSSPSASDEITQQQIETMATRSLNEVDMQGEFTFDTQRMVSIDLHFSESQNNSEISIYTMDDNNPETSGKLLERGVLYNSSRYRGMLSVPTFINSLTITSNGDTSGSVVISIDKHNRVHHVFEEFLL